MAKHTKPRLWLTWSKIKLTSGSCFQQKITEIAPMLPDQAFSTKLELMEELDLGVAAGAFFPIYWTLGKKLLYEPGSTSDHITKKDYKVFVENFVLWNFNNGASCTMLRMVKTWSPNGPARIRELHHQKLIHPAILHSHYDKPTISARPSLCLAFDISTTFAPPPPRSITTT